jgi:uncharacterized protein (DUF2062 family)
VTSLRERWRRFAGLVRAAFAERATPGRVAAAIALGVLLGMSPLLGLQMILGAALSSALKLNRVLTILGTNVTFGPLLPAAIAAEVTVGAKLLGRPLPDLSADHVVSSARDAAAAWWLGFVVLGVPLSAVLALVAFLYARRMVKSPPSAPASD